MFGRNGLAIGFKTSPQGADWETLDMIWATAGELGSFDAAWLNDHLVPPRTDRGMSSFESVTLMAALAHRVPGHWLVHGVLANTLRYPAIVAKAATVLDHATGGRFIIGIGAGGQEPDHAAYGIPFPSAAERMMRLKSAIMVLRAMFSESASRDAGIDLDDPFYPLQGATNQPAPVQPGGPPIWLGVKGRKGLSLAAAKSDGWIAEGSAGYEGFVAGRDYLLRELDVGGRPVESFTFVAQVRTGGTRETRRQALAEARRLVDAGVNHLVLGLPADLGAPHVRAAANEIAQPLRDMAR
jgi:alkanesulfonate monooxygenase SsuD/methylene tetrahydromethanopterin reductase-like flavin-dependent oxidoreductase (luciferase family)